MEFELRHHFPASIAEVARVILDRNYQESLDAIGPLKSRTVLSQEEREGSVVRRVRCVLDAKFAGPAKGILGAADPAWIEESTWLPEETSWRWTIVPEVAAALISAHGAMSLYPAGQDTTRVVSGEVSVNVPFIGGKVEQAIVDGIWNAYNEEAERLARWLTEPHS
ncbi:MAG: hypothetical protein QOG21_1268 [Actinomycetota bacterium]|nr:hypothetical protein [Actinomycetota bacterium]